VTEDHGPFHILPLSQSHKLAKQRAGRFSPEKLDQFVEAEHVIKCVGSAGTALLCNTELCWHRAGIPAEGNHRDIVQFQFKPSDEPLSDNWIDDIEMKPFERKKLKQRQR
jgi:ectoine hydroxylase-related dioxygenase (phytanoyl-CoA dioxygenase family)